MADLGGLSPHHAAAGFGGGLAYLPFMAPAGRLQILMAIITGVVTAMFLTPVVAEILSHPGLYGKVLSEKAELGLAFLLGLTAMILLPAIIGVVTYVRDNIKRIMDRVAGLPPEPKDEEKPK